MNNTKYKKLCNDECHACIVQLHKSFDFDAAAASHLHVKSPAASHLVSQSRLQVARQSYILEVGHIHLCDWRRSLVSARPQRQTLARERVV